MGSVTAGIHTNEKKEEKKKEEKKRERGEERESPEHLYRFNAIDSIHAGGDVKVCR
jgi:hypothetical protein